MTTVLIVDDDVDIRLLVRLAIELANDGLEVVGEAADGSEALQVWKELDGPPVPDVVILDNRMPELSGLEVAERILAERPDQIVILYSAHLDARTAAAAQKLGVAASLSKSDHETLPDLVRQLAREHPKGA